MKPYLRYLLILFLLIGACKQSMWETRDKIPFRLEAQEAEVELKSGTLMRIDSFPSNFVRVRTVDVWLPENYSDQNKYAVLYMHDGQMLFDAKTTWNKQEWMVDEIVGSLIEQKKIRNTLVVAIWNHADIRHKDYYPKKPIELIPQSVRDTLFRENTNHFSVSSESINSDRYLQFIVEEVKPFIDRNYATLPGPGNTFIAGSSMGGLISMYAICEYPEVFGGAACLSTHWPGMMPMVNNPIPESFFGYMEQSLPDPQNHKLYFDYGTETLDAYYLRYQHRVDEVLKEAGYTTTNAKNIAFEGHDHSEKSWNKRFQIPVQFLLK